MGEFSELIADVGGQENAFTSNDYTAYFQRVPKEHLRTCMEYEADRMQNLVLTDEVVAPERDVVLEERRMRTDSDPADRLNEAVQAALFTRHPYGRRSSAGPTRSPASAAPMRSPITSASIRRRMPSSSSPAMSSRKRSSHSRAKSMGRSRRAARRQSAGARASREPHAHRLVTLADEKVEQPSYQRLYPGAVLSHG